jgi:hypothetical protein
MAAAGAAAASSDIAHYRGFVAVPLCFATASPGGKYRHLPTDLHTGARRTLGRGMTGPDQCLERTITIITMIFVDRHERTPLLDLKCARWKRPECRQPGFALNRRAVLRLLWLSVLDQDPAGGLGM